MSFYISRADQCSHNCPGFSLSNRPVFGAAIAFFAFSLMPILLHGVEPIAIMPTQLDHTSMWWVDGFPGRVEGAPWHRCIQTGHYQFVLDTRRLSVSGFASRRSQPSAPKLQLTIDHDGKTYFCTGGGEATRHGGPRVIESGRFFQHSDVTDLQFTSKQGDQLQAEARLETAAWPDRLSMILAVRPGRQAIVAGQDCFGKIAGGFGIDGTNDFEVAHNPVLESPQFTLCLWAFVPSDYQASEETPPWLVCKDRNEETNGNFGIVIANGIPEARLNIGGGQANKFVAKAKRGALKLNAWNFMAISYDGQTLRFFVNGQPASEKHVGRKRTPGANSMTFGRRQDNLKDRYRFRGVIDEVRYFQSALTDSQIRQHFLQPGLTDANKPALKWTFRSDVAAASSQQRNSWKPGNMKLQFGKMSQEVDFNTEANSEAWQHVGLAFDPVTMSPAPRTSGVVVKASEIPDGKDRPVQYDRLLGWHRINLDGVVPIVPEPKAKAKALRVGDVRNDSMERMKILLANPTGEKQTARLMFEKTAGGFRQQIGTPITGVSAILRDADGNPTGLPVQLSKNWHYDTEAGPYQGQWFHGISQVVLPPGETVQLELSIVYGHWGGVAAASHSHLSLIGWGGNQLWQQTALGAWGESLCLDPDQAQADCTITDVRPLMVQPMNGKTQWGWTNNVGGGDFFRMFDADGDRVAHRGMQVKRHRQGPCLTEVTNFGRLAIGIDHSVTVSLARTDDLVRATYQLQMKVNKATKFSRFVIFQIGADTYCSTTDRKMAIGNAGGLTKQWSTQWGGETYRTSPTQWAGPLAWASIHDSVGTPGDTKKGASANRGVVIRDWDAKLGGKKSMPWIAERGVTVHGRKTSTLDVLPGPNVQGLEPGDFITATIEHLVVPQFAKDYYGPSQSLRSTLQQGENTWQMVYREATGNDREVTVTSGELKRRYPDVRIVTDKDAATLTLKGGLGYVPITFSGLTSPVGNALYVNGQRLDQSVHGNDFWQTDYTADTKTWSRTYNVRSEQTGKAQTIELRRELNVR